MKIAIRAAVVAGLALGLLGCGIPLEDAKDIGAGTEEPAAPADAEQTTAPPELTTKDIKLRVKTLSKQCFGGVVCNVEYCVEVAGVSGDVPDDAAYEVSYAVRGPEAGTEQGTLRIQGGEYEVPDSVFTQTPSAGTKLKVKVTEVVPE